MIDRDHADTGALLVSFRRLFPMIRARCARILKDPAEAEDVAQETFLRLWSVRFEMSDPSLGDLRTVTAWIYRTSTRLAIDRARSSARLVRSVVEEPSATDPEKELAARQDLATLARLVPSTELAAAVLVRFDGLTHQEAAEVLDVSERTIRRWLRGFDRAVSRANSVASTWACVPEADAKPARDPAPPPDPSREPLEGIQAKGRMHTMHGRLR